MPGLGSKCSAPSAPDRRPHAALVTHDPNRTLQAGVPMPPVDAVCETHPGGARPSHHDIQSDPRFADAPNIARTLQRWVRPRKSVRTGLVWGFSCQAVVWVASETLGCTVIGHVPTTGGLTPVTRTLLWRGGARGQACNGLRAGAKGMRTVGPANEVSLEFRGGVSSICSMPEQLDDRNPTHHT